jgi:hypothetical protein
MENQSVKSGKSNRTASGAIIREVNEEEWEETGKNSSRNKLYKCKMCGKQNVS